MARPMDISCGCRGNFGRRLVSLCILSHQIWCSSARIHVFVESLNYPCGYVRNHVLSFFCKQCRYYCGIYCLLSTIHIVLNLAACLTFIAHGARASKNIHGDCLHNLLQAPLSWFESVPSGRILSRFSADLAIMDVQFSFYGDGILTIS